MAGAAVPVGVHNQPPSKPSSSQITVCVGQAFFNSTIRNLRLMAASLLCITQRLRGQGTGAGLPACLLMVSVVTERTWHNHHLTNERRMKACWTKQGRVPVASPPASMALF